jgi:hypothetical protein
MILIGIVMFFIGVAITPSDDTVVVNETDKTTADEAADLETETENDTEQVETATEENEKAVDASAIIFSDQVVYDDNGLVATVMDYTENYQGLPEFKLLVENNSETDYEIKVYYFSINDIMVSAGISESVTAVKKCSTGVELLKNQFDLTGISEIDKISMVLTFSSDNDEYTKLIDLKIREKEPDNSYLTGETLFSEDRWDLKLVNTLDDRSAALIAITNHTDKMMDFSLIDYSVNDFMGGLTASFSQGSGFVLFSTDTSVLPNCTVLCELDVDDETLENVEEISAIDFKIQYHFEQVTDPQFLYEVETTDVIHLF